MRASSLTIVAAAVVLNAGVALAGPPDGMKYPNLAKSWQRLQAARDHLQKAEVAHAQHGTLGGHGAAAVAQLDAAQVEIDQAIAWADAHRKPGPPGVVTPRPPLTAGPDDVKYPNLGDAHLDLEWAVRHVEDAMQYHAPTGSLGGHGERTIQHLRAAQREIVEAERWADTHRK